MAFWFYYKEIQFVGKENFNQEKGDNCYLFDNFKLITAKIIEFKEIQGNFETFNLSHIEDNHNFFANGI